MIQEVNAIVNGLLTQHWHTTPIAWDNIDYVPKRGISFIRPRLYVPSHERVAMGFRFRASGYVSIDLFVPKNTDTDTISGYADELFDIFVVNNNNDYTVFHAPTVMRMPQEKEWYSLSVTIPFTYDTCL